MTRALRALLFHLLLWCLAFVVLAPVVALVVGAFGAKSSMPFEPVRQLLARTDASGDGLVGIAVTNSLRVSGLVTLVCLLFAPPAGYALSRTRFPGRQVILAAFVGTLVAPLTLLLVPTEIVLGTLGLRDSHLGLILAELGLVMPLTAWLMKRAFDGVPLELEEAARLEGASASRIYWLVALPSVRGAVFAVVAIAFAVSWSEYAYVTTLVSKARLFTLAADIVNATKPALSPWQRFAPAAMIAAGPAVALLVLAQRRFGHFLSAATFVPRAPREE
jgi:ABC-type glycerol-3-phosphate transport system permease component